MQALASLIIDNRPTPPAVRWMSAAQATRDAMSFPLTGESLAERDRYLTAAREALGEAAFAAAWDEGRQLSWQNVSEEALGEAERSM